MPVPNASKRSDAPKQLYLNPIIDCDFPDPAIVHAPDGYYYAYATQALREDGWVNVQVARSADLIEWQYLGDALPAKPRWASTTQDFWAPSVIFDGTTYFMYYSATPDVCEVHQRGHALAVATSNSPAGPFVDMGEPLLLGVGFEFIDPMAYDDPVTGKHLLYWGSGFQPIKVQELAADRRSFATGSAPIDLIWPNGEQGSFPRLVEASWVIRHEDFFYLFYSGDNCCGPHAEYGVMVARSKSATGPFETLEQAKGVPHSLMLSRSDRWLAPGHNCIIKDEAGQDWIVYHAIDIERPRQRQEDEINSRRVLLMDRIEWRDGWPHVGTPSVSLQPSPVV
ncbi:glycoside hydrolase family 43 protein [Sphingomonas sp. KRR8]|uniref:glycoside hydrolase family 43 protein n=1 Tax=Sphingomonas sp. KRR8 TaxID=2942996 RepID=UPI002022666D|nr:glycoside hydrolase family 43 protein [Sphingomonas sp. KRR8]URD60735.1 glycoside hydrolase family 43 protein [Sphingomonas sp. KRR8]